MIYVCRRRSITFLIGRLLLLQLSNLVTRACCFSSWKSAKKKSNGLTLEWKSLSSHHQRICASSRKSRALPLLGNNWNSKLSLVSLLLGGSGRIKRKSCLIYFEYTVGIHIDFLSPKKEPDTTNICTECKAANTFYLQNCFDSIDVLSGKRNERDTH